MFKLIGLFFVSLLLVNSVSAKRFTSQFCEFELPSGWTCNLEGSEWVCQSENVNRTKEAIIILAAKLRGTDDSLDKYNAYLKKGKSFTLPGGKIQMSESKYSKYKTINGHRWVDALHLASEVPGFYTRYLATVKEDLGVAVTFSVAKDHYTTYQGVFDSMVATLRVFRQKNIDASKFKLKKKGDNLLDNTTFIPETGEDHNINVQKRRKKGESTDGSTSIIFLVVLAVVGFILVKFRKKKTKKKKK